MEFNFGIPSLSSPSSNPFQLHERVAWYGRNRRREGRRTNSKRYLPPLSPSFAWGEVHIQLGWGPPPPPPPACFPTSERLPEAHFKLKQTLLFREAKNHSILPPPSFSLFFKCALPACFSAQEWMDGGSSFCSPCISWCIYLVLPNYNSQGMNSYE